MNFASSPKLCKDALCIAGNPVMGAVISSFFNKFGEYLCLLEPPRMARPDYSNEILRRNNVAARLQPDTIILAGLEQRALSAFRQYFSPKITTEIESLKEVEERLREVTTAHLDGEIFCNPKEIAYGLLLAKTLKMRLRVDASAPSLEKEFRRFLPTSGHLILVEDSGDFAPIIAANYAFSVNAELKLLPPVTRDDIDKVYDNLLDRQFFRSTDRGKRAQRTLKQRSEKYQVQMPTTSADFVTFVTRGVPYGYFFPDIPSTHLFSYPDLGLNIFAGIYHSSRIEATRSAVVVDPGHFQDTESDFVVQNLGQNGIFVKSLKGNQAKVYEVRNHIQYYPYDFLYICCHAGEMDGKRLKIRFNDRLGQSHEIVVDHAIAYAPTGEGRGENQRIEVTHFTGFVELDGVDWGDKGAKAAIGSREFVEDFTKIPVQDWEVLESSNIPYVKNCVALKLTDHYCIMLLHLVADHEYPIVFNNACVSFFRFSEEFLFAGARAYIGTLAPVANASAKAVAKEVLKNLNRDKPLPVVLWEAQKRVLPRPQDRTYVHLGCHFANLVPAGQDMTSYMELRLRTALERWSKKQKKQVTGSGVEQGIKTAIKFLTAQVANFGR